MATKTEIDCKVNEVHGYEKKAEDYERQIARLRVAYQKLAEVKVDFRNTRVNMKDDFEGKGRWRGEKYDSFCDAGDELDDALGEYYRQLDAAHDAINRKIGDLRAKQVETKSIIGKLWGAIRRLEAEIQNIGN